MTDTHQLACDIANALIGHDCNEHLAMSYALHIVATVPALSTLQAENDRLRFEANAGRQAEAEANEEIRKLVGALTRADEVMSDYTFGSNDEDEWNNDDIIECRKLLSAVLAKHAAQAKAGAS